MSLTRDECIETRNLLQHWFAWQILSGSLDAHRPPHQPVPSAGSLAVILQPAFVPFDQAVEYLLFVCLVMPVLVACVA
jgi:hypothetical protein